MQKYRTGK